MTLNYGVYIDWKLDGSPANCASDVRRLLIRRGRKSNLSGSGYAYCDPGTLEITLKNQGGAYNYYNTTGELYGYLLPNRPIYASAHTTTTKNVVVVLAGSTIKHPFYTENFYAASPTWATFDTGLTGVALDSMAYDPTRDYYYGADSDGNLWRATSLGGTWVKMFEASTAVTKVNALGWTFSNSPRALSAENGSKYAMIHCQSDGTVFCVGGETPSYNFTYAVIFKSTDGLATLNPSCKLTNEAEGIYGYGEFDEIEPGKFAVSYGNRYGITTGRCIDISINNGTSLVNRENISAYRMSYKGLVTRNNTVFYVYNETGDDITKYTTGATDPTTVTTACLPADHDGYQQISYSTDQDHALSVLPGGIYCNRGALETAANWKQVYSGQPLSGGVLKHIRPHLDGNTCWVAGGTNFRIGYTANDGATWTSKQGNYSSETYDILDIVQAGTAPMRIFTGSTRNLRVFPSDKVAAVQASDASDGLKRFQSYIYTATETNKNAAEAIGDILTNSEWTSGSDIIDNGDAIPVFWHQPDKSAWDQLTDICKAFGAEIFIDTDGNFVYVPRTHNNDGTYSIDDDDVLLTGIEPQQPWDEIRNSITVYAYPRVAMSSSEEIYRLNDPVQIPASDSIALMFTCSYDGDEGPMSAAETITATTDYLANDAADGGGTNRTGSVTVSLQNTDSAACKVVMANAYAGAVYLTLFKLRGKLYLASTRSTLTASDATSQTNYGVQNLTVDTPFIQDRETAEDRADEILLQYKSVRNPITIQIMNNPDLQFAADLFDVVNVDLTTLGAEGEYRIAYIEHDLQPGRSLTTWRLEQTPRSITGYWLFPADLEETTRFAG